MKVRFDDLVGRSLGRRTYKTQRVGLELEYENCTKSFSVPKKWGTTNDYSLRAGGMEFVSIPLLESDLDDAVPAMVAAAKEGGSKATKRCGYHVHVNVTYMTFAEMYKFITYYTLLEPLLFREFAPGREMSHFCVPTWSNTVLTECLYHDNMRLRDGIICPRDYDPTEFMRLTRPGCGLSVLGTPKYAALNMNSLKRFGTLEFRQAPSSLDPKFIISWAQLLLRIQRVACEYADAGDIVTDYDESGLFTLCEKVNFCPSTTADELDQEDAADAATIIAGHIPVDWQQLEWEVA